MSRCPVSHKCTFQIFRIQLSLSSQDVFQTFITKYNSTVPETLWKNTFYINREFIKKNLEKYNFIIEMAILQGKKYLKLVSKITNNQGSYS